MARFVPNQTHANAQQWSDKSVQRLSSYVSDSINHAMGRNTRIVNVLCYVSLMTARRDINRNANVSVKGAVWQNYKSQAGRQAAHYLPGQLRINSRNLCDLTNNASLIKAIRCQFGDVDDLPANFNKADTQAEAKGKDEGLCEAFQKAVEYVISNTSTVNEFDRNSVRDAYRTIWKPRARTAYIKALEIKSEKYSKPELQMGMAGGVDYNTITNLGARECATAYQHRINHQQEILRHYFENLNQDPTALIDEKMDELVRALSV